MVPFPITFTEGNLRQRTSVLTYPQREPNSNPKRADELYYQMNEEQLLEKAIAIAVEAHRGQRDRYGLPYILHPIRVMCRMDSATEKIVAILHDVVEDTDWTFTDLQEEGFSRIVLDALDSVTKREGEAYEDFVKRSASNPLGRKVKLADLEDNMDLRRLRQITEHDRPRLQKYLNAWNSLNSTDS
jgi:(p)ppGpp synthase/HD superfamily hydrolase